MILVVLAAAALAQQPPTFKVDVRLVRMLATVKDAQGRMVGGLNPSDFLVTDNGVQQEVALFERSTSQPLSIALLVDTSRSTERERRYELDSVRRFVKALLREGNPADALALYSFDTSVTRHTPYTRNAGVLFDRLDALKSEGGTSLYDALYLASNELSRRPGRHVVLTVSDGGDTVSRYPFQKALEALHEADAVMYSTIAVPVKGDAGRNLRGENALITLSTWTGGQFFMPTIGADMNEVFERILRDLRTQYLIGYYPRNVPLTRERFHKVELRIARPGHTVTARNGYYSDDVLAAPPSGPKPLTPPALR